MLFVLTYLIQAKGVSRSKWAIVGPKMVYVITHESFKPQIGGGNEYPAVRTFPQQVCLFGYS